MKTEILRILRESDGHVSGQQLCEQMGVSRTAIWKVIGQLKEDGYRIEAVRNKGYIITEVPDIQSKEELQSILKTSFAGHPVVYFAETDSTNIQAKVLAEQGAAHGTLVLADCQTAGRGRRGRNWVSAKGENIYMSLLLRPDFPPAQASMLTLVMAYSVATTIREKEELHVKIKWPNDIVLRKQKVCGILTEMSTEIDYINYVVIGVGINVNASSFPEDLKGKAMSLSEESRKTIQRSTLTADILLAFEEHYRRFVEAGDLRFMVEEYNRLLVNQDKEVQVLGGKESFAGTALGMNAQGELLVKKEDGTIEHVFSGEVSVRGMYGYV